MEAVIPYVNGIFNRVRSWVADKAAGLNMDPGLMDQDANDIALGLSTAMLRDGTSAATADLPMAGHKLTSIGAPANPGDVLSLGSTPSTEISRALGFQPVSSGAVGGHQVAITYDGTGLTSSVDGNAAFGRVWTANTLGAAQLWNILGCRPLANYNGTASNQIGLSWNGGRLRGVVDGSDQGALWTDTTLTAGQIGAILGYAPARPSNVVETSAAGISDMAPNTRQYIVGANFVAQSNNFVGIARSSFSNQSSGAAGYTAYLNCDLIDLSSGNATAAIGIEMPVSVTYGQGWAAAVAYMSSTSLTLGHTYQARVYCYKTSTGAVIAANSFEIIGENF